MNQFCKAVIAAGGLAVALMCTFPPWKETLHISSARRTVPLEHSFLLSPPEPDHNYGSILIDRERLLAQLAAVGGVTISLCLLGSFAGGKQKTARSLDNQG